MKKPLKIYFLLFIFIIFTTYNAKHKKKFTRIFFPVKKILVENTVAINSLELRRDLNFLLNSSLFFLDKEKILLTINKEDFVSNFQLKKVYPNTLKIEINEKLPVAIQLIDKKKFYITKKNEKINFVDIKVYKDLPLIFGNNSNFNIFYNELKKNNFEIKSIKAFYYFDIGRWDILLKNEKTIKFPEKNYLELLTKINLMLNDSNFSKYKTFDFRVKDQLILK